LAAASAATVNLLARKDPGPIPQLRRVTVAGAKGAPHPGFVPPQLATLRNDPPRGDKYVHEIKFDGYRLQAHLHGGLPSLWTRSGLNWTKRFPPIAVALSHIPATQLIVDGEVISANEHGAANFSQLQDDLSNSRYDRVAYYAFDLLYLDGYDLRAVPLIERKKALHELLAEAGAAHPIIYSEHFDTDGASLFRQACEMKLEGIVSKFIGAPYKSERNESWVKVKCVQTARYEVIGYKTGATSLYLAKREGKDLLYVGKAGTGFTNSMILELARLLKPITLEKMPLAKKPDRKNKIDHWAAPKYWAEVEYRDITTDGLLRHTTFRGLYASRASKKPLVSRFEK
jgi:bifunctional non-homologous end joining protein LigD